MAQIMLVKVYNELKLYIYADRVLSLGLTATKCNSGTTVIQVFEIHVPDVELEPYILG